MTPMGQEIERKFLVAGEGWRDEPGKEKQIVQAYIGMGEKAQVRVRIIDGTSAVLTVKDCGTGLVRQEYEYAVPPADARAMLELRTGGLIEKTRKEIRRGDLVWEVDCYSGGLAGLVVAEVELADSDDQAPLPDWAGREVTGDPRYYNATLALDGIAGQS